MSNYSEGEVAEIAVRVIEEFGKIKTSELIVELEAEMKPTGRDLESYTGRSDTIFSQTVRNMISHKNALLYKYVEYEKIGRDGLLTSKAYNKKESKKNQEELESKKKKRKKFTARKVNFQEQNELKMEIGLAGEEFILEKEKEKLPKNLSEKVIHVSKEHGDGAGYDILSYDEKLEEPRYLEVKTTTSDREAPFYISQNEKEFIDIYGSQVKIVRVYNFNLENKTGDIFTINGNDFDETVEMHPISYKCIIK